MISSKCVWLLVLFFAVLSAWVVSEHVESENIQLRVIHSNGEETVMDVKAPRAEGDDPGASTTAAPSSGAGGANSTALDECEQSGSGCCYQFTWPGRYYDTGNTSFSCGWLRNTNNPCKEPIVFTKQNAEGKGRRPDLQALRSYCNENGCKIYCSKTTFCIKYSFFENDDGTRLYNETKFCGTVTSVNKGSSIRNGCFREKVGGFTKEVCVCDKGFCNSAPTTTSSTTAAASTLLALTSLIWGLYY